MANTVTETATTTNKRVTDLPVLTVAPTGYLLFIGNPGSGALSAIAKENLGLVTTGTLGQPNGLATLDHEGKIPASQIGSVAFAENGLSVINGKIRFGGNPLVDDTVIELGGRKITFQSGGVEMLKITPATNEINIAQVSGVNTSFLAISPFGNSFGVTAADNPALGGTISIDLGTVQINAKANLKLVGSIADTAPSTAYILATDPADKTVKKAITLQALTDWIINNFTPSGGVPVAPW